MRRIAAGLTVALALAACAGRGAPDLILVHARIFTADSTRPWAEALAIRGERIVAVGPSDSLRALAGPRTRVLDVRGRTVIPGINDAHAHPGPDPAALTIRTASPDPDLHEVAESLASVSRRVPRGRWLRVAVWERTLENARARRFYLDSVVPDDPVVLASATGHELVYNSAALAALDLGGDVADPLGGRYGRVPARAAGGPPVLDGRLEEYAVWKAGRRLSMSVPDSAAVAYYRGFADTAVRLGITSVQVMSNRLTAVRAAHLLAAAATPLRWRVIAFPLTGAQGRVLRADRPERRRAAARVVVSGVKYVLDGTPIERGAAMRAPYADRPGWHGRLDFPADTVRAIAAEALARRDQLMLHVSGDSAAAVALAALAAAGPDSVWRALRPRFEHGDHLMPDQIPRAREFGVVVVQNPSHLTLAELFTRRYGAALAAQSQPLRSLIARGVPLALGSDGPLNPFLNIMFAVTRPGHAGEALSREQAVAAYTRGSAYAEFAEGEKGTLAPGMLADVAVLSRDIFSVSVAELPQTASVLTLVGGTVVYDAGMVR